MTARKYLSENDMHLSASDIAYYARRARVSGTVTIFPTEEWLDSEFLGGKLTPRDKLSRYDLKCGTATINSVVCDRCDNLSPVRPSEFRRTPMGRYLCGRCIRWLQAERTATPRPDGRVPSCFVQRRTGAQRAWSRMPPGRAPAAPVLLAAEVSQK